MDERKFVPQSEKFETVASSEIAGTPEIGARYTGVVFDRKSKVWVGRVKVRDPKNKGSFFAHPVEGWEPIRSVPYEVKLTEQKSGGNKPGFFGHWEAEAVDAVRDQKPHLVRIQEEQLALLLEESKEQGK